jgi:hypothetical protein
MTPFLVYSDTRRYIRHVTSNRVILWTHNPADALPMTRAEATAMAVWLQRSAGLNGPQYQPSGEYGVERLGVQETNP